MEVITVRGFVIAGEGSLFCAPNAGQWRFFGNYAKAAGRAGIDERLG